MIGTRAISGSLAISLVKRSMAATPSIIPSSMQMSMTLAPNTAMSSWSVPASEPFETVSVAGNVPPDVYVDNTPEDFLKGRDAVAVCAGSKTVRAAPKVPGPGQADAEG